MAQPTTPRRRRTPAAPPPPPRPMVRDFSRSPAPYTVEWDVRSAYDFVISLSNDAGSTDDLPAQDRRWLTEARAALPEERRNDLTDLFGSEVCIQVAMLLLDRPAVKTAEQFVEAIGAADSGELLRTLLSDNYHDPEAKLPIDEALRGDP